MVGGSEWGGKGTPDTMRYVLQEKTSSDSAARARVGVLFVQVIVGCGTFGLSGGLG